MANSTCYANYETCKQECSVEDTPEDVEICIADIRTRYKDQTLCAKITEPECQVIRTGAFAELMRFLIKFFKLQYCCRKYHANQHDVSFITALGALDLAKFRLSIDDLNCVKLQDFAMLGFPSNLGDYFRIIQSINQVGIYDTRKDTRFIKFDDFLQDSQPWSRVLTTCIDKYVRQLGILESGIPDISKISLYGDFITECDKDVIDNEILPYLIDDPEYILRYIMKERAAPTSFDSSSRDGSSSQLGWSYYDYIYRSKSPRKSNKSKKAKKNRESKKSKKAKKTRKFKKSK